MSAATVTQPECWLGSVTADKQLERDILGSAPAPPDQTHSALIICDQKIEQLSPPFPSRFILLFAYAPVTSRI